MVWAMLRREDREIDKFPLRQKLHPYEFNKKQSKDTDKNLSDRVLLFYTCFWRIEPAKNLRCLVVTKHNQQNHFKSRIRWAWSYTMTQKNLSLPSMVLEIESILTCGDEDPPVQDTSDWDKRHGVVRCVGLCVEIIWSLLHPVPMGSMSSALGLPWKCQFLPALPQNLVIFLLDDHSTYHLMHEMVSERFLFVQTHFFPQSEIRSLLSLHVMSLFFTNPFLNASFLCCEGELCRI